MQHDPRELLHRAAEVIDERGATYGTIENNFQLIADLASLRLGRKIHPYEIATIMCSVKEARLFASPSHTDSRLDLANYEMFAAMFAEDYEVSQTRGEAVYLKQEDLPRAKMTMPPKLTVKGTGKSQVKTASLAQEIASMDERYLQRPAAE